ncbi:hypothetical protein DFH28DRAFT_890313 [Melampsora americana]|nr:hypothetical protein DFH28DRAFT_890313 [Melampsora americana]
MTKPAVRTDLRQHKYWDKVQTIPSGLKYLLEPDVDYERKGTKKEDLRDMMKHFDIDREKYPIRWKKDKILGNYKDLLLPDLQLFIRPVDPATHARKMEHTKQAPFLTPSTSSIDALRDAVLTKIKASFVVQAFNKIALTRLWRHAFYPPPGNKYDWVEFYMRPHCFTEAELGTKSRDVLRHALQCEHPQLFIPLVACTEPILRALYAKFILEKTDLDTQLCYGVHYYIIEPPLLKVKINNTMEESDDDSSKGLHNLVKKRNKTNQNCTMAAHASRGVPSFGETQSQVEHYNTQDLILFNSGGPVYMRGVCTLRNSFDGQATPGIQQDVPLKIGTNIDGVLKAIRKQGDPIDNVIIMTPDGSGYFGGVHTPRNQLTMVDGKPNLLFHQMLYSQKPSFENMTMRELAEWRLGILIHSPEVATQFNRVFNFKRVEEGYNHRTYPVPFASDMSDELEEKIASLEYDNSFIRRCLRLAEEAADRGQVALAPTLSELHGVHLKNTAASPTASNADAMVVPHDKIQIPCTLGGFESIHSVENAPLTKVIRCSPQTPESSRKRPAHPTPPRGLHKRKRTDDNTNLSGDYQNLLAITIHIILIELNHLN